MAQIVAHFSLSWAIQTFLSVSVNDSLSQKPKVTFHFPLVSVTKPCLPCLLNFSLSPSTTLVHSYLDCWSGFLTSLIVQSVILPSQGGNDLLLKCKFMSFPTPTLLAYHCSWDKDDTIGPIPAFPVFPFEFFPLFMLGPSFRS